MTAASSKPREKSAPASRVAKSPEAFRTISEVATELDLPQHVLRFWETRFSQIKPLKRAGGRRLYRPDHVALLRGIKALLYEDGMTIKGVQKMLREKGIKTVIARGEAAAALTLVQPEPPADAAERLAAIRRRLEKVEAAAASSEEQAEEQPAEGPIDTDRIRESIARLERLLERLEGR